MINPFLIPLKTKIVNILFTEDLDEYAIGQYEYIIEIIDNMLTGVILTDDEAVYNLFGETYTTALINVNIELVKWLKPFINTLWEQIDQENYLEKHNEISF